MLPKGEVNDFSSKNEKKQNNNFYQVTPNYPSLPLDMFSLSLFFFFLQNPILCNWTLYRSVLTRAPQIETVIFFPDSILLQYNLRLLHIFSTYPRHISDHNELVQHTWYHRCDYFPGLIYQSSVAYLDIIRNQLHHKTLQIIRVFFFPGPDI